MPRKEKLPDADADQQNQDTEALDKSRRARLAKQRALPDQAQKQPEPEASAADEEDDERTAPRLSALEVATESTISEATLPMHISLHAFTHEQPIPCINFGPIRHYGAISLPDAVRAVPVRVNNTVTFLTAYDVMQWHERRVRPMVRLAGTTSEMKFESKQGRMRAKGFVELSRWLQMRGLTQSLTMPAFFSSQLTLADQIRQLLCGDDPGPKFSGAAARPIVLPVSLADSDDKEFELTLFDGANMVIGEQGSGKTLVLAAIARHMRIEPVPFSETGPVSKFGYPMGFVSVMGQMMRSNKPGALDNARYLARIDNKVLMQSGWSAATFELFLAMCQDLERRSQAWLIGLNPMTNALNIAKMFRGTASTVIEVSPIFDVEADVDLDARERRERKDITIRERVVVRDGDIFVPIRYSTRRVASRPVLEGLMYISEQDIEFGKHIGIIGRADLESLQPILDEQEAQLQRKQTLEHQHTAHQTAQESIITGSRGPAPKKGNR